MQTEITPQSSDSETGNAVPSSCPFVGTDQDANVCYSYANRLNHCYRKENSFPVALDHQDAYCLSVNHISCELFQAEGKIKKLPRDIYGDFSVHKKKKHIRAYVLFSLAVIVMGIIFSLAFLNQAGYDQFAFLSATKQMAAVSSPSATSPTTPTPKPVDELDLIFLYPRATSGTPTDKPAVPTNSPLYPTPGPEFGVTFGKIDTYILHKVGNYESYHYIADLYDTSVEAIQVLNNLYDGRPLNLDQVIVVKPGEQNAENLPRFALIQLGGDTPLELIAEYYSLSEQSLSEINDLGEITLIPAGRWLLIPIEE